MRLVMAVAHASCRDMNVIPTIAIDVIRLILFTWLLSLPCVCFHFVFPISRKMSPEIPPLIEALEGLSILLGMPQPFGLDFLLGRLPNSSAGRNMGKARDAGSGEVLRPDPAR